MSSLKKAIKKSQRIHRERGQLSSRAHLGQLERRSDYKKRAADYHDKQETLVKLRKHAMDRNPDEFHYHMNNSHIESDGRHFEDKKESEDTELQKQLGSIRDLEYVKFHLNKERKKIEEMKASLHLADGSSGEQSKHTIFVEDEEEARAFDPVEYFDTTPDAVGRKFNRPRKADLCTKTVVGAASKADVRAADRLRKTQYKELEKRIQRERELAVVVSKLELKKNLAKSDKGALKPKRVKKGKATKAAVYEWTYVRKR